MNQNKTYNTITAVLSIIFLLKFLIYLFDRVYSYFKFHTFFPFGGDIAGSLLNSIYFIPSIIGFLGLITFKKSKFKKSSWLQFYLVIVVVNSPFELLFLFLYLFDHQLFEYHSINKLLNQPLTIIENLHIFFYILLMIANITICWFGLFKISKYKSIKTIKIDDESDSVFKPIDEMDRLFNLMIDLFALIYIIITIIIMFGNSNFESLKLLISEYPKLCFSALLFYYYFFLEGVFGFTAGKCITNSIVVTEFGEIPKLLQILRRTLYRFIPLNPFSFLGKSGRGWHDTLSNTYVIAVVDIENNEQYVNK